MKVKIGEVCSIISGTTPKTDCIEYWDGSLNWITPAELIDTSDVIYDTKRKITAQAVKDTNLKLMPIGTVILSSRAPIGKVAITGTPMYCNQGFKNLVCSSSIYNRYLFHFLKSKREYLNSLGRGATFKEISKKIVENIKIPLPSLEKQHQVAEILDQINIIIAKRKEQYNKLDELIKSRFIEMFGDLTMNTLNWKYQLLSEVCDVRDGTHDSPKYIPQGYPLLTSKNFTNDIIDFNNVQFISKEDFLKINSRSKVDYGDIIMPMIGTIGYPVIVNTNKPFAIKNVALIKFRNAKENNKVLNIFIMQILKSNYFKSIIKKANRGGTQKFIALKDIRNIPIPLPPLELQEQFTKFVNGTNKSKAAIQNSLAKLETLKKSLMQEYFA